VVAGLGAEGAGAIQVWNEGGSTVTRVVLMGCQVATLYSEFEQIKRGELGEEGEVWCRLEEVEAGYVGCARRLVGAKSVGWGDVEEGRGVKMIVAALPPDI